MKRDHRSDRWSHPQRGAGIDKTFESISLDFTSVQLMELHTYICSRSVVCVCVCVGSIIIINCYDLINCSRCLAPQHAAWHGGACWGMLGHGVAAATVKPVWQTPCGPHSTLWAVFDLHKLAQARGRRRTCCTT